MYHAEAKTAKVSLEESDKDISLTILDDGKGFEINQVKQTPGITSMRKRTTLINGHLNIDSAPGKGTRVFFSMNKI
jgi:signal transduction histidine kinase